MQENILQKIEDNAKKVACLYFIVEIIVFMIAGGSFYFAYKFWLKLTKKIHQPLISILAYEH